MNICTQKGVNKVLHHEIFPCEHETSRFAVLLHGFGGNHRIWKHQIPVLQKNCNVLAIDLPSHNTANIKLTQITASIQAVTKEILKVLDSYNITKAMFIGVSLGTIFIRYIEEFYPRYADKALLVGAVCNVGLFLRLVVYLFSKIGDKLPFKLVYNVFSKVLMPSKNSKKSRKVFCECAKVLNRHEFKAWMHIFKENFKFNKRFAKNSHKNNLYVVGVSDFCFIKGIKQEASLTGATLELLKDCGHVANIDQKEKFNKILENFS